MFKISIMIWGQHRPVKQRVLFVLLLFSSFSYGQQKVIRLYAGKPPGSEYWNWQEQVSDFGMPKTQVVYNVVEPTLTLFPAKGSLQTGTAVIIAPGGGLFTLSIGLEGTEVAEWLSQRGVTAFVLKYRLVHIAANPQTAFGAALGSGKIDSIIRPIIPLAMNDGLAAVAHVRRNAALYNVHPEQIGFMGFSAGGGVAMSVAYHSSAKDRPNFIAPIYAWDKS
ncbi:MAG TPA: alpha/beta hydrolase, partial [Chitinophagaceae bacterium]|nr:alpha/beta hydrolase [Chitinophagaceae bacterium]